MFEMLKLVRVMCEHYGRVVEGVRDGDEERHIRGLTRCRSLCLLTLVETYSYIPDTGNLISTLC